MNLKTIIGASFQVLPGLKTKNIYAKLLDPCGYTIINILASGLASGRIEFYQDCCGD